MRAAQYRAIAQAINDARVGRPEPDGALDQAAENIADVFAEESDRFERDRFLKAAGAA